MRRYCVLTFLSTRALKRKHIIKQPSNSNSCISGLGLWTKGTTHLLGWIRFLISTNDVTISQGCFSCGTPNWNSWSNAKHLAGVTENNQQKKIPREDFGKRGIGSGKSCVLPMNFGVLSGILNMCGSFSLTILMQLPLGWLHSHIVYWAPSHSPAGHRGWWGCNYNE